MLKRKKILVTGASGFVGANVVRELIKKKHKIHIFLRKKSNIWRLKDVLGKLIVHKIDLTERKLLVSKIKEIRPDVIFHLATYGAYPFQSDLESAVNTNIIGLTNLLEASKDINYDCFVVTGSSSEYGFKDKPMKETDATFPASFYGATKVSATLIAQAFAKKYNKPIVIFRLFSVYGPYEEPTRFIPIVMNSALKNKTLKLAKNIARRDFIHVNDVVNAFLKAMTIKKFSGEIFNIGTGKEYSNKQIAAFVKKINKGSLNISIDSNGNRPWDSLHWVAKTLKSRKNLKWSAKIPIERVVKMTFDWFDGHRDLYK